uniref:Uncharacterized protein n=1 Tax=Arundo donax TaxID=35708 RepID=A0A0A9AY87_ARUDO
MIFLYMCDSLTNLSSATPSSR